MKLSKPQIAKELKSLKGWKALGNSLQRTIKFSNFMEGLHFVISVAYEAEKIDHHPDVVLKYGEVIFILTTHSEKGITDKDIDLAKKINKTLGE
jgi:4a-hydroxytetrahydrobiopterin dehydratase